MISQFILDWRAIRRSGIPASLTQQTAGRVLRLSGARKTALGLSDRPTLSGYAEVQIEGCRRGPSLFIKTDFLLSNPQLVIGYTQTGMAILLGIKEATKGNITVIGPSQTGKSTWIALVSEQILRHGYLGAGVSLTDTDPVIVAGA